MSNIRSDIESQIADILNRGDLSSQISNWFNRSHREIQRLRNWTWQERKAYQTLQKGVSFYVAPPDLKAPIEVYTWDQTANNGAGALLRFYTRTSIQEIDVRRNESSPSLQTIIPIDSKTVGDDVTLFYAIFSGIIELWPNVASDLDGKQLFMRYYRWVDPPSSSAADWITTNAQDWLIYKSLVESGSWIPGDSRTGEWKERASEALKQAISLDVMAAIEGGELVMRG